MRDSEMVSLVGAQAPPGKHQLAHLVDADDPRYPDRAAATYEYPQRALRQRVRDARLRHAHVGREGELQAAADDSAVEGTNDRDLPALEPIERAVPELRVLHHLDRGALAMLGKVQAGAEVVAVAEHHAQPGEGGVASHGSSRALALAASRSSSTRSRAAVSASRSTSTSSCSTPATARSRSSGVRRGEPRSSHHSSIGGPRCSSTSARPPTPAERCWVANGPSSAQRRPGP